MPPRATTCMLDGTIIDVQDAIDFRNNPNPKKVGFDFRCVECAQPVRPHKDGKNVSAHFEHHKRNTNCRLSDPAR